MRVNPVGVMLSAPLFAAALLAVGTTADAQSLATRVAQAPDGVVRVQFDGRPGVCGDGREVVGFGHALFAQDFQSFGRWEDKRCVPGPIRVTLSVEDHDVTRVRTQVGGSWRPADGSVTDLGVVPAREASAYFFSLVPKLERASDKDRLLLPAVLADDADDADVVAPLLALARDANRVLSTRRSAVMWLGQLGDARVIPPLVEFARQDVDDDGEDKPGKKSLGSSAMMALSMLDGDVGVPALIDLAKTATRVGTRRNAIFWLGQNGDPRGIAFIRAVIDDGSEDQRVREHAIFALSQDDRSDDGGRFLIAHVRDSQQPMWLRRSALFWAGQGESTPTAELVRAYRDADARPLREHAIFVLSQRSDEAATDALLQIARSDADREMRGKALFWLAQKDDPRVRKLIGDIILK